MSGWQTTDENFAEFWDRIESSYPGWKSKFNPNWTPPPEQETMRLQTMHREAAGREIFGDAYLTRDNIREAREELADCLMYLYLDTLKDERLGIDPEWDIVLSIADDLLRAYKRFDKLRRKHRGAP